MNQVVQSGRYAPLPVSQVPCIRYPGTGTLRDIQNGTAYDLRISFHGPVQTEVTISPGQARALNLPAGSYEVLGRVTAPGVLPFYGEQTYNNGEQCAIRFYLGPSPR
jgi:hypothetical protein